MNAPANELWRAGEAGGGVTLPRRTVMVTGDDFGSSRGANRAIVAAHERGILTNASLMVTGAAWEEAVALARAHPALAVGLHLVLVHGRSVLPWREIPCLVDRAGRFSGRPVIAGLRYHVSPAARRALAREIRAQLERFRQTGLPLRSVDGHHHMHLHPVVLQILVDLAPEFGISAIRLPGEELGLALAWDRRQALEKAVLTWVFGRLRASGAKRLRAAGIRFPERVYGLLATGQVTEPYLLYLIPRIRANAVEIYAHPAVAEGHDSCPAGSGAAEFAAFVSDPVREALRDHEFTFATSPACP